MDEQHIYYLDLSTLLTRLTLLRATLTTALPHERIGIVQVEQGRIVACTIWGKGQTLEGAPAFEVLREASAWQLAFAAQPPVFAPAATPTELLPAPISVAAAQTIPTRQQAALTQEVVAKLPPKERLIIKMVFLLVDGHRSVQEIHTRLQLAPDTIERALHVLATFGMIVYL